VVTISNPTYVIGPEVVVVVVLSLDEVMVFVVVIEFDEVVTEDVVVVVVVANDIKSQPTKSIDKKKAIPNIIIFLK
jgi:hypothetical protein